MSVILTLGAVPASAQAPRRNLPAFSANVLPAADDFSTGPVSIGFTINLFGGSYSSLYVNNNGNVTFDAPLLNFTPVSLAGTSLKILAPFWADVDTRAPGSGVVSYGTGVVNGRPAFGVEWPHVGYFSNHGDKLNSFELVIIDRSDIAPGDFDLEYNYDSVQWETGSGNGGVNGLGGSPARVGYSNGLTGTANVALELPGSSVPGALIDGGTSALVPNSLNTGVPGRYLFWIRRSDTPDPGPSPVATPAATLPFLLLTGVMLIGMVWYLRPRTA